MKSTLILFVCLSLSSCWFTEYNLKKEVRHARSNTNINYREGLEVGEGRIFADNPIIVMNDYQLSDGHNMNEVIRKKKMVVPISDNTRLEMNCRIQFDGTDHSVHGCFKNLDSKYAAPLINTDNKWGHDGNSMEFLQVNVFGHSRLILDKWMQNIKFLYEQISYDRDPSGNTIMAYDSSIPENVLVNRGFWFGHGRRTLTSYSNCNFENNAHYAPAENVLCYGKVSALKEFYFAQDPTIVYHEIGHALQRIMLNIRNWSDGINMAVYLGHIDYNEGGAINEGVSDYFSYFMTGRDHLGEWSLGRFLHLSRPLAEDDPLHSPGISLHESERVSYPEYLMYDPNNTEGPREGVHNAGMIISHYLTALTRDVQEHCFWDQDEAVRYVMSMLIESYAEMGDLTSKTSDNYLSGHLNLNSTHSWDWITKVHPINFRKFSQTMAKKIYMTLSDGQALKNSTSRVYNCGNSDTYPKENIENILDMYGLLLFDTYNLDGNGRIDGHSGTHTDALPETNPVIDPLNRKRTTAIKKRHLIFDPNSGAPEAYIFDRKSEIRSLLQILTAAGRVRVSNKIPSNLAFNNDNGQISPGEVVGIILNLYNNSNATMGGVQVLANDWDHVKFQTQVINGENITRGFPCNNLGDNFPLGVLQGAADLSTGEGVQGGCDYVTRYNGSNKTVEPLEELAPICLVEMETETATTWVQQDEYVKDLIEYDESKCLGDHPRDCLVRAIRGADQAWVGQIPSKSSFSQNYINNDEINLFTGGQMILLEINPEMIMPGTTFTCRFRGRFTNCEDCFQDPNSRPNSSLDLFDDFLDYEYSGARPFTILNFTFTIID